MKPRHLLPAAVLCAIAVAVAGCGNKGPLVRASDVPPPVARAAAP
ncbi:MAG: LPS translocon maturation chaperone LptM, partial [Luteimonas sp.]